MKEESEGRQWDWAERIQEVLVQHCSAPHCPGPRAPVSQWDVLTDVLRKLIDLKRPPPPPHTPSVNQQLGQQRAGNHARARAWEVTRRTAPVTVVSPKAATIHRILRHVQREETLKTKMCRILFITMPWFHLFRPAVKITEQKKVKKII